jgi:hypothetical protein
MVVQLRPLAALTLGEIKFKMSEMDERRFRACEKEKAIGIVET